MAGGKDAFYAVKIGYSPGIYKSWNETERQTKGFPGAEFKKFKTQEEAFNFISPSSTKTKNLPSTLSLPSKSSKTNANQKETFCKCNVPAKLYTTSKEGVNIGRKFYGCSKFSSTTDKCNFFKWEIPSGSEFSSLQNYTGDMLCLYVDGSCKGNR